MDYADLIARLRAAPATSEVDPDQCADAIVALQARVAELEQGRVYWVESAVKEEERAERAEAERDEFQRLLGRATTDLAAARAECAALQALRTLDLAALVTLGQERDGLREQLTRTSR